MQEPLQYIVPVEVREADDGPKLRGTILQEGRAAQGAALNCSRREVWCGRLTESRFWANIAARSWPAPSRPGTQMDRFASRHTQPRRFSPPTPHASFSVWSFTRSARYGPPGVCEKYNAPLWTPPPL